MSYPLRRLKRSLKRFGKSAVNAARAFDPNEVGYRLTIQRVGGFEVAFRSGTSDEIVIRDTLHDDFFADLPEYVPGPADVILDVGAHIGAFALVAATRAPSGRVYAIEASQESFNYLRINRLLNGAENIRPQHVALSDRTGEVRLYHDHGSWGHSVMLELSSEFETVEALTLSGFLRENAIERCDFAKFNCEGAEFPILLGTDGEDLRRIEAMLVYYHSDLAPEHDLPALESHLRAAGFEVVFKGRKGTRGKFMAFQRS